MHTFRDNAGRDWTITITVSTLRRVQAVTGLNLATLANGGDANPLKPLAELIGDALKFAEVLHAVLKPEIEARGLKLDEFCDALAGDALFEAGQAFARAFVFFFHPQRTRAPLLQMIEKSQLLGLELMARGLPELEAFDPAVEAERILKSLTSSSGSVPEFSALTPDHSL